MSVDPRLIQEFYGRDPLKGRDALESLSSMDPDTVIRSLVPLQGDDVPGANLAVEPRMKRLAANLGAKISDHLIDVITQGPWSLKLLASPYFAGLDPSSAVTPRLIEILKEGGDLDACRLAIEALGYLGAHKWSFDIAEFTRTGDWDSKRDSVSRYEFDKLASYTVEAFARFAAHADNLDDARSAVSRLTEMMTLKLEHHPNHTPDAYMLVMRVAGEFTTQTLDALVHEWGDNEIREMQELGISVIGTIATARAATFLLRKTDSTDSRIARSADIALGELRMAGVADRILESCLAHDSAASHIWSFSALYPLISDKQNAERFVAEVLSAGGEPAMQMRYSLSLCGDDRCRKELVSDLDSNDPYERWASALCLARLLGSEALSLLRGRLEESADEMERAAFSAALLRCGDDLSPDTLLRNLEPCIFFCRLRAIWRIEILDVLRTVPAFRKDAFTLWCESTQTNSTMIRYYDELMHAVRQHRALTQPNDEPSRPQEALEVSKAGNEKVADDGKRRVFVSYSRKDKEWRERFRTMIDPLVRQDQIEWWDDTRIRPGKWHTQIDAAMARANVALFLVSPNFLRSDFIMENELPELLAAAENQLTHILWVLLEECLWEVTPLKHYQAMGESKPLANLPTWEQSKVVKETCLAIMDLMQPPV